MTLAELSTKFSSADNVVFIIVSRTYFFFFFHRKISKRKRLEEPVSKAAQAIEKFVDKESDLD